MLRHCRKKVNKFVVYDFICTRDIFVDHRKRNMALRDMLHLFQTSEGKCSEDAVNVVFLA